MEACLVRRRRGVEEGVVGSGQYRDVWGVPLRERHGQWSGVLIVIVRCGGGLWWGEVTILLDTTYTVWSHHLNIDDTTHHQLAGNVGATFHNTNHTAIYT